MGVVATTYDGMDADKSNSEGAFPRPKCRRRECTIKIVDEKCEGRT